MSITKLDRKVLPSGTSQADWIYQGRPAKGQGDFGSDVGLADAACVNQLGETNNAKYYHGGVVKTAKGNQWAVYLEWGRMKAAKSWNGSFGGGDYQFVMCSDESEARKFFATQLASKNTKRLAQRTVGGATIWASRDGEDGYLVQDLATREKGLPDAYGIKDLAGVPKTAPATTGTKATAATPRKAAPSPTEHPTVVKLANDLVGGVKTYTRALTAATGIKPSLVAIEEVRKSLIPAALGRIGAVGPLVQAQVADRDLIDITKMVAARVPREIPRSGLSGEEFILNTNNIQKLELDLDTFESALSSEDSTTAVNTPSQRGASDLLNANIDWVDPNSELGKWVLATFGGMTRNRHSNFSSIRVRNVFAVSRPDRDALFVTAAQAIAAKRKGTSFGPVLASLQPATRPDMAEYGTTAKDANVFLAVHGTRSVNVAPIVSTHFRLPASLSGVQITGAAFGGGVYTATDFKKAAQYVGASASAYGYGGGISGRGHFMFLCDVTGGKFFYPRSAWSIGNTVPDGADSVYAHPNYVSSLGNDEHVVMNPNQMRIRYLLEVDV